MTLTTYIYIRPSQIFFREITNCPSFEMISLNFSKIFQYVFEIAFNLMSKTRQKAFVALGSFLLKLGIRNK